jgi:hypothetical protein
MKRFRALDTIVYKLGEEVNGKEFNWRVSL